MFKIFIISLIFITGIQSEPKPNILFICVDDLRNDLGCYGHSIVKSPNIDALARRGMKFNNHYVQIAVCNPSRTSMLLGMRPDKSKVFTLSCKFQDHVPEAVSIPQYFAKQGYHSVGIGKIDHGTVPDPQNWSEPKLKPKGYKEYSKESLRNLKEWKAKAKAEGKPDGYINRRRPNCIVIEDIADNKRFDGAIAEKAASYLEKLKGMDKPFFFAVGFVKPHMPFNAPKKYWDLYNRDDLPLSERKTPPAGAPRAASSTNYELRDYIDFVDAPHPSDGGLSDADSRKLIHGYYAAVSYMDAQVGRLIKSLDDLELTKNTVIVLWSDHGWKLGDYRGFGKMTNYEIDTCSPLIIIDPRQKGSTGETSHLVESLDLFPTLCDLAGLSKPSQLDGRSLVPVLKGTQKSSREAIYTQYFRERRKKNGDFYGTMGQAVRSADFRYVAWRDFETGVIKAEELYDLNEDPLEMKNIINDVKSPEKLKRLRDLEKQYWPPK